MKCPPGQAPDKFGKCRPIWGYRLNMKFDEILDRSDEIPKIANNLLNDEIPEIRDNKLNDKLVETLEEILNKFDEE